MEARREILEAQGDRLAAGSDDPLENSYIETVVWADIDVGEVIGSSEGDE